MPNDNYIQEKLTFFLKHSFMAHHEAGHCILSLLHFMRVNYTRIYQVEIGPEAETEYDSIFEYKEFNDPELFNYEVHSEISMLYAGSAAERILYKNISGSDVFPNILKEGSWEDNKKAYNLIINHINIKPGKERSLYKKNIIKETIKTLIDNWNDIELIAHALFKKKKLFYKDLKKILTTKSKNKDFWKDQLRSIDFIFKKQNKIAAHDLKVILGIG